jgi:hypothetical protein
LRKLFILQELPSSGREMAKRTKKKSPKKRKGEDLYNLSKLLFDPRGKEPYYLGHRAIRNLEELKANLDAFGEEAEEWVASWIAYLGDQKTAARIRKSKGRMKEILLERYQQLRRYYTF